MTMAPNFDTYDAANEMRDAGFEEKKVGVLLKILKQTSRDDHLVTKEDLDNRINQLEDKMNGKFVQLEQRMTIRLGGLILGTGAVLGLLARYLPPVAG